ncbi:hypothetical protein CIB48_g9902 [Xylaria polymorpha]|nr:hypothetical protein CIB48_g9902 [Xylaria polymorpha]
MSDAAATEAEKNPTTDWANRERYQQIEIWKVKKLIKRLEAARGNGTSMISLIIPPKDQISRISKMLAEEYGTASNIKSRVNRQSVLSAITSTQQRLKLYNKVPPNGLVVYCGEILTSEGKERKVNIDFEPFKPINTSLYLCDNKFHTEALAELLESDQKFGFIVMDGNGALFGTLSGNTRDVVHKFSVDLPKKHGRGGQSALRFARLREEKRHNYVRKVAELAVQNFITSDKPNVAGLILAGSADFKNDLNGSDMFDNRLQSKVIKVVDVSYGGENGFNQAIELSSETLGNVKFIQEKKLIGKYFEEISQDTGKVCYGIEDTLKALELGAVEILIVFENLEITRWVLKDTNGTEVVLHLTKQQESGDRAIFMDKETGQEMEVVSQDSFLEWIAEHYKDFGTNLEFVSDRSTEGNQFVKGFGGIGGILRYKFDESLVSDEGRSQAVISKQAPAEEAKRALPQEPIEEAESSPAPRAMSASYARRRLQKIGPANSEHTAKQVTTPSPLRYYQGVRGQPRLRCHTSQAPYASLDVDGGPSEDSAEYRYENCAHTSYTHSDYLRTQHKIYVVRHYLMYLMTIDHCNSVAPERGIPDRAKDRVTEALALNTSVVTMETDNQDRSGGADSKPIVCFLGPISSYTHQATMETFPPDQFGLMPVTTIQASSTLPPNPKETEADKEASGQRTPTAEQPHPKAARSRPLHPIRPPSRRVYSHPQAFGQCTAFLGSWLRGVETVDVSSTSRAAELALADASGESAALSSAVAASLLGLDVLAQNIEDREDNTTRFFVLRRGVDEGATSRTETTEEEKEEDDDSHLLSSTKSLLSFTVPHRSPGALADVLSCFRRGGLNLTSINSRPSLAGVAAFEYIFFVEFEGHRFRDPRGRVARVLGDVAAVARTSRWLGSWENMRKSLG